MLSIKVLGSGCENCKNVEALARKVVSTLGIEADIVKITDGDTIRSYKPLSTPGLVINEKLVSAGRIPTQQEITDWVIAAVG